MQLIIFKQQIADKLVIFLRININIMLFGIV